MTGINPAVIPTNITSQPAASRPPAASSRSFDICNLQPYRLCPIELYKAVGAFDFGCQVSGDVRMPFVFYFWPSCKTGSLQTKNNPMRASNQRVVKSVRNDQLITDYQIFVVRKSLLYFDNWYSQCSQSY